VSGRCHNGGLRSPEIAQATGREGSLSHGSLDARALSRHAGAPVGEHVIIKFASSFEIKANALETVTPMVDADITWRVSGYYVK
jgi:hypothetical protein